MKTYIYKERTNQEELLKRLLSERDRKRENRAYLTKIISAVAILDVILFLLIY